jgi:hypothetical protein
MSSIHKHRGEILEKVVKQTGLRIEVAIRKTGYSRSAYYKHIKEKDLSLHILIKYGNALNYDFSFDIPDLKQLVGERNPDQPVNLQDALLVISNLKEKYLNLLEKYNILLEQGEKYNK